MATATKPIFTEDTGEMLRLRVVSPTKSIFDGNGDLIGGHIFNGYIGKRVYLNEITDIPKFRPYRDDEGRHLMNEKGELLYRENVVPKWADLIEVVPAPPGWRPATPPRRPVPAEAALSKGRAKLSDGRSGKMRGATSSNTLRPSDVALIPE